MIRLENVQKIRCEIDNDVIFIHSDQDPNGTTPHKTNTTGQRFKMERVDDQWDIIIEEAIVSNADLHTELKTPKSRSDLDFSLYKPNTSKPRMKFIGIQDIRDGARTELVFAYKDSNISVQTSGDTLIIRKAQP